MFTRLCPEATAIRVDASILSISMRFNDPMSETEFQRQLTQLLRAAAANGIEVRGGWTCQIDGDDGTACDVEIVEVANRR